MTDFTVRLSLIVTAGALALSACTSNEALQERRDQDAATLAMHKGAEVDGICFTHGIDDFAPATRTGLVVRAQDDETYLIETMGCTDLDRAKRVTIASRSMCVKDGDIIRASDTVLGGAGQSCRITGTYAWKGQG